MRRKKVGSVAQLNRASDYGSEGYGFESHRSHKAIQQQLGGFFLCMLALLRRYGTLGVPFVHMIANMGAHPTNMGDSFVLWKSHTFVV